MTMVAHLVIIDEYTGEEGENLRGRENTCVLKCVPYILYMCTYNLSCS